MSYLSYLTEDIIKAAKSLHTSGDFEAAREAAEKIRKNAQLEDDDIKSKIQKAEECLKELRLLQKELSFIEKTQINQFEECIDAGPVDGDDNLASLLYRINGTKAKIIKTGHNLLRTALRKR